MKGKTGKHLQVLKSIENRPLNRKIVFINYKSNILKELRNNFQPIIQQPTTLSFESKSKINIFQAKMKLCSTLYISLLRKTVVSHIIKGNNSNPSATVRDKQQKKVQRSKLINELTSMHYIVLLKILLLEAITQGRADLTR